MPVRLHHIVVDAHDLPGLARFWIQALGWKVLSERENEIVIGTEENAPLGMCFMPVTDPKTVKNRVHLDLTSSAADRDQEIDRLLALGARRVASARPAPSPGLSWPIPRERSSGRAPEGNAHPMRLSTQNRRQTLSAGITPDHACDRGALRLDPRASRSQAYQP